MLRKKYFNRKNGIIIFRRMHNIGNLYKVKMKLLFPVKPATGRDPA